MRGLPGSGKSTLIKEKYPNAIVCSADHFFIDGEGKYTFLPKDIGNAHAACLARAIEALKQSQSPIVIDNTNTQKWEYSKYLNLAQQYGYNVLFENLFDGGLTDEELAARNTHNVPLDTIHKMRKRWQP